MLCLRSILVAYFGNEALYCLEVVVTGSWLCHFGPRPAVRCPGVTLSLLKPYWAHLTLLSWLESCRGIPKSPGIKSSQFPIAVFRS